MLRFIQFSQTSRHFLDNARLHQTLPLPNNGFEDISSFVGDSWTNSYCAPEMKTIKMNLLKVIEVGYVIKRSNKIIFMLQM